MSNVNVEKAMELYKDELIGYECTKKIAGGVVIHFSPVGQSGYFIGTFTAYDRNGLKSERALPFDKYIRIVNEVEDLLEPYQVNGFTGRLAGWNATPYVKSFLFHKKVHRLFFLNETHVLSFVKRYTGKKLARKRAELGVEIVIMFG